MVSRLVVYPDSDVSDERSSCRCLLRELSERLTKTPWRLGEEKLSELDVSKCFSAVAKVQLSAASGGLFGAADRMEVVWAGVGLLGCWFENGRHSGLLVKRLGR